MCHSILHRAMVLGTACFFVACGSQETTDDLWAVSLETGEQARFSEGSVPPGWAICPAGDAANPCGFVVPPEPAEPCAAITDPANCQLLPECLLLELCLRVPSNPSHAKEDEAAHCFNVCVSFTPVEPERCEDLLVPRRCNAREDCGWHGRGAGPDIDRWPWQANGQCLPRLPKPDRKQCASHADCTRSEVCDLPSCEDDAVGTCKRRPDGCPDIWLPVCGCDGKTYGNDCERLVARVARAHRGECAVNIACRSDAACGKGEFCNKKNNLSCAANMPGVCETQPSAEECLAPPILHSDPIYLCPRSCEVVCTHAWCPPEALDCKPNCHCVCPGDPVCGCDNVTYRNDCLRRAAGVDHRHDGPCISPWDCDALRERYRKALTQAQACTPDSREIQCSATRPSILGCPCPLTSVNPSQQAALKALDAISRMFVTSGCFKNIMCPAVACPSLPDTTGVCESDDAGRGHCSSPTL